MKSIFSVIWSLGCLQIQKPHGSFYYRRSSKLNNCTESGNVCHTVNGEHMTKIVNQGCVLNLFILPYLYQFSPWFSIYWIVLLYQLRHAFMCDEKSEKYNDEWHFYPIHRKIVTWFWDLSRLIVTKILLKVEGQFSRWHWEWRYHWRRWWGLRNVSIR